MRGNRKGWWTFGVAYNNLDELRSVGKTAATWEGVRLCDHAAHGIPGCIRTAGSVAEFRLWGRPKHLTKFMEGALGASNAHRANYSDEKPVGVIVSARPVDSPPPGPPPG